jgi:hypothetical protein
MRRNALWPTMLCVASVATACGVRESSTTQVAPKTKNAATAATVIAPLKKSATTVAKPSSAVVAASPRGTCSPLGAIYQSNPVFVAPPESYEADDSFSYGGGDCSFLAEYGRGPWNVAQPGVFEFQWSETKTVGPVVVEISRDGLVWQALETSWSAAKPNSATARISLAGQVYVRVRSR